MCLLGLPYSMVVGFLLDTAKDWDLAMDITVLGPGDPAGDPGGGLNLSLGQEQMGAKISKGQRQDWPGWARSFPL